jgi:hypothetical protein
MQLTEEEVRNIPHCYRVDLKWSGYKSRYKWFTEENEAVQYAEKRFEEMRKHPTAGPKVNGKKVPYEKQQVKDYSTPEIVFYKLLADDMGWEHSGRFSAVVLKKRANGHFY